MWVGLRSLTHALLLPRATRHVPCVCRRVHDPQEGITIADCSLPDMPLIYANAGFQRTTGYSREFVLGKNCRWARALTLPLPSPAAPSSELIVDVGLVGDLKLVAAVSRALARLRCAKGLKGYP